MAENEGKKLTADQQIAAMRELSQKAAAWLVGRSLRGLRDDDAPRTPGGKYNAQKLAAWEAGRKKEKEASSVPDERTLAEAEFRRTKAEMAKLDLEERLGQLLPLELVEDLLRGYSGVLRKAHEAIQRKHPVAAEYLEEALDACETLTREFCDSYRDDTPTADD